MTHTHGASPALPGAADPRYLAGLRCFRAGRYWDCHEVLENLWLADRALPDRAFFQGIIQAASAVHLALRGAADPRVRGGATRCLRAAREKFAPYRPTHRGLDVAALLAEVEARLADPARCRFLPFPIRFHPAGVLPEDSEAATPYNDASMSREIYRNVLESGIEIVSTSPDHADGLEALQKVVFPTLAPEELLRAPHYRKHVELFPEGQFAAIDPGAAPDPTGFAGGRIVGMTTTVRLSSTVALRPHTFAEVIAGGWLTSHDPDGEWLYGVDVGTHPEYRGRGIARGLYAARQTAVHRLGLKGQITVGMMSGYGALKHEMAAETYYEGLEDGLINDPTVSAQVHIGFEIRGLLPNYLHDPVCDNYGVVLVLDASRYVPAR